MAHTKLLLTYLPDNLVDYCIDFEAEFAEELGSRFAENSIIRCSVDRLVERLTSKFTSLNNGRFLIDTNVEIIVNGQEGQIQANDPRLQQLQELLPEGFSIKSVHLRQADDTVAEDISAQLGLQVPAQEGNPTVPLLSQFQSWLFNNPILFGGNGSTSDSSDVVSKRPQR